MTSASTNVTLYAYWQTAVATLSGTNFSFDLKDADYVLVPDVDYLVDDTTNVHDAPYKSQVLNNPILAFFADLAYADDDKFPTWHGTAAEDTMTDVGFSDHFGLWYPRSTSGWFYSANNLNIFNGKNLNLDQTSNMAYMFCNCDSLTSVDMQMFDTHNVLKMKAMFANDYHLRYIYVHDQK